MAVYAICYLAAFFWRGGDNAIFLVQCLWQSQRGCTVMIISAVEI